LFYCYTYNYIVREVGLHFLENRKIKLRKLFISKDLKIDPIKINTMGEFCNFVSDELEISDPFTVYVVSNRENHGISTTAVYHIGNNLVKVYGKNRALVDIMRSIAHEMTHMMQDQNNRLIGDIPDIGGEIEDEANSLAGSLIKKFAKNRENKGIIYESIFRKLL
tara:strand:+ start:2639 stop:3133 length:495 start_codon:yes stop_codon:yes gene_type:complete